MAMKSCYNGKMNDLLFTVTLATIGIVLIWLFYSIVYRPAAARREYRNPRFEKDSLGIEREKGVGTRQCPVCATTLATGMQVKSKIFTQQGRDRLMHVFGCPYCWPDNTAHQRICPVCHHVIPRNGYLISRYFENASHKHVHVLGCSGCRRG